MARPLNSPHLGHVVTEYPTPILGNTIETEVLSVTSGKYDPLPYGTRFNDVQHGEFPKHLPDHVLVYDAPYNQDGTLRRRVWVNDRLDQELYNIQIDYEGNNPAFPIYTRVYVLPRDGYTPLAALSLDPVDEFAFLISEQVINETQPPELANIFVKVVRIYHTLPGQIIFNVEYPYGGMTNFPRITTRQKVRTGYGISAESGALCPVEGYGNAELITQVVQRSSNTNIDELARVYEITPQVADQTGYGYSISYAQGDEDFPTISWTFTIERDTYAAADNLSLCPIEGFETLILSSEKLTGDESQEHVVKITRVYETLPGPLSYQVDYEDNEVTFPIVKTSRRVRKSLYSPGVEGTDNCTVSGYEALFLFEQHAVPTENVDIVEDQRVFEASPGNTKTTYDYDTDLNALVRTTRQKILSGQVPDITQFDALTVAFEQQPQDKWRNIQIISALTELPAAKVEHYTGRFPFPTLLTGITLFTVELSSSTDNEVVWYPNTLRPLQNVPAVFRVTTSFFSAEPPAVDLFVMPTRDLIFRGQSFEISITNVLNDEITVSASFSGDTQYGDLSEGITWAPTNPSATDYYNAIGTYQVVGVDITRYRGNIWSMQLSEVVLA
jgi:hypothetical protein